MREDRHDPPPAFWHQVEEIFSSAVNLSAEERIRLLDSRCGTRSDVRAEVESLLAVHSRAGDFMRHPTLPAEPVGFPTLGVGDVVGQFRLVQLVASGGMGTVFRAERADRAFEQRVAVKIISAPIAREDVRRRFFAERQILASLQHPHIVGLLDAGLTETGQPYLIMEFVDGAPITRYCHERGLSIDDRLRLLRHVCDAVQYAHAHFVVHRDLKPANVLVTSEGVPKVLDFGIATLLEGPFASAPSSGDGVRSEPLTPNYASPEQLRGDDVTVATDVFGLGVLMFELLTGSRPFDLAGKPLDEVLRIVNDTPTRRPSESTRAVDAALPYDVRRALRGDLDAIVVRACHRTPADRYGSADALSQDLARYLDGAPVAARKPTLFYVAGKLASRHRIAFAAAALSALFVLGALGVALWQARVATIERHRADRRFNEVRQLANAVIFTIHDAVAPLPGSTPVRQTIVTEGLKYLERLTADSQGDRQLQLELGRAYLKIGAVQGRPNTPNLGDREGAIASFRRAKALLAPLAEAPNTAPAVFSSYLDSMRFLSETLGIIGASRKPEAIDEARHAVDAAERFAAARPGLDEARAYVAAAVFALAIQLGPSESLPYWNKAGAEYDALLAKAPEDPVRQRNAALVNKYVGGLLERSDLSKALEHYQRALDLDQKRFDRFPDDRLVQFDLAVDFSSVAYVHWRRHELANALTLFGRSLDMRERLVASDPKDSLSREKVAYIHRQIGRVLQEQGESTSAIEHLRRAIDGYMGTTSISEQGRADLAGAWANIGYLEAKAGRAGQSCDAYRRSVALYRALPETARRSVNLDQSDPMLEIAAAVSRCGDR